MLARSASLVAALALAGFAAPAEAQDVPALPPLPTGGYPAQIAGQVPNMGYSYDQRATWLEQCHAAFAGSGIRSTEGVLNGGAVGAVAAGNALDAAYEQCDGYLQRYEQAYAGYRQGYAASGEGVPAGFENYPGVTWVRIPIGNGCSCRPQPQITRVIDQIAPPVTAVASPSQSIELEGIAPLPRGKTVPIR